MSDHADREVLMNRVLPLTARSAAQTEFLLSTAIGHAEQPGVLPEGIVQPIQHLLRNVMYYRSELAGSWIDAAGELAEEILSIDPAS